MEPISIEKLIKILNEKNVNLGKGDPYNRLRYYTKIGWLPHMIRKKNEEGVISGHYPYDVIDKIIEIEKLKVEGKDNEEITKLLNKKNKINPTFHQSIDKIKNLNPTILLITFIVISVIIESIRLISHNENTKMSVSQNLVNIIPEKKIIDTGIGIISQGQNKIFVASSKVTPTSIILLNFFNNIGYNNNYFIKEIKIGQGFFIETIYNVPEESKFNWAIIE